MEKEKRDERRVTVLVSEKDRETGGRGDCVVLRRQISQQTSGTTLP